MKKIILFYFLTLSFLFASIGKVSNFKGSANIQRGHLDIVIKMGQELEEKDIINTGENAVVKLSFTDETLITIGKNSQLDITEYLYDKKFIKNSKTKFRFLKGTFQSITGQIGKINPDKFKLATKTAVIGIRGTTILGNQQQVACTQGMITVSSNGITRVLKAGMITKTKKGVPPTPAKTYTPLQIFEMKKQLYLASNHNKNGLTTRVNIKGKLKPTNATINNNIKVKSSNLTSDVNTKNISVSSDAKTEVGSISIGK